MNFLYEVSGGMISRINVKPFFKTAKFILYLQTVQHMICCFRVFVFICQYNYNYGKFMQKYLNIEITTDTF